jgi:hypothetical protein
MHITSNTIFASPLNYNATMTIHAVGGDVTLYQQVDGTFEQFGTVTSGTMDILEYGLIGESIMISPSSSAQINI